jgi:hypothetical protein
MSQSLVYLQSNQLIPGPDFRVSRGDDGGYTGSMSFSCRYQDWKSGLVSIFRANTPITDLYAELDPYWSFLILTDVEVEEQPGGITRIVVQFGGSTQSGSDDSASGGSSGTFQISSVQIEQPIYKNKNFRNGVTFAPPYRYLVDEIGKIREWGRAIEGQDPDIREIISVDGQQTSLGYVDTQEEAYSLVVEKGIKTASVSTFEISYSETNRGGIPATDYKKLGFFDDENVADVMPEQLATRLGSERWLLTTIVESRTTMYGNNDDNSVTWTKTWRKPDVDDGVADFLYKDQPPASP